jgi:hypothetical protein
MNGFSTLGNKDFESFDIDLGQIIEVGVSIKTGSVLVTESPAPIFRPPSPEDARRGRGRHFRNRLWRSVGAEEFVIVFKR